MGLVEAVKVGGLGGPRRVGRRGRRGEGQGHLKQLEHLAVLWWVGLGGSGQCGLRAVGCVGVERLGVCVLRAVVCVWVKSGCVCVCVERLCVGGG